MELDTSPLARATKRGRPQGTPLNEYAAPTRWETDLHAQQAALRLGELGGRASATAWCRDQGWGIQHTQTVLKKASQLLVSANRETAEEMRARLLTMMDLELKDAANAVSYDKEGNPRMSKDRGAIAAFTRIVMTLGGLDVSTVHHVAGKDRPLRELTTEQLLAEEAKLSQEIYDRAAPVESEQASTLTGIEDAILEDAIPLEEKTLPQNEREQTPTWVGEAHAAGLALRIKAASYGSAI